MSSVNVILDSIKKLTVVELSDLVKAIETEFGVSAAAAVAVAAPVAAGDSKAAAEKSEYKVVMKDAGAGKIAVIKALRAALPALGLKEAKDLTENTPCDVAAALPKAQAQELKKTLEEAGATIELV